MSIPTSAKPACPPTRKQIDYLNRMLKRLQQNERTAKAVEVAFRNIPNPVETQRDAARAIARLRPLYLADRKRERRTRANDDAAQWLQENDPS